MSTMQNTAGIKIFAFCWLLRAAYSSNVEESDSTVTERSLPQITQKPFASSVIDSSISSIREIPVSDLEQYNILLGAWPPVYLPEIVFYAPGEDLHVFNQFDKGIGVTGNETAKEKRTEKIVPGQTTYNGTNLNYTAVNRLCGFPSFSNRERCRAMNTTSDPLSECQSRAGEIVFGIVVMSLAWAIIIGNSLLPIVVILKPSMRNKYNYIKVSLAFCDMITGFVLLTIIPNMIWSARSSESEILAATMQTDRNSAGAIIIGSLLNTSIQASLLHLMFLSIDRFISIKWPLWHRLIKTVTVLYTLVIIWFISILSSFIPAVLNDYFEYTYQPVIFIHMMTTKYLKDDNLGYHGPLYATITMLLPYAIMLIFSVLTGVVVFLKFRSSKKLFFSNAPSSENTRSTGTGSRKSGRLMTRSNPEISAYKTLILMIFAFSVTLLPAVIVLVLFHHGYYKCDDYSLPNTIAFYIGAANSLVNVIIYSTRDKRFRDTVRSIFARVKSDKLVIGSSSESMKRPPNLETLQLDISNVV